MVETLRRAMTAKWVPWIAATLFAGPVFAGLAGTIAPAFGWASFLGHETLTLDAWRSFFNLPGVGKSIWLSFFIGISSAAISVSIVFFFFASAAGGGLYRWLIAITPPFLAAPHAAAALGIAFLLAPSGWLSRLLSPWATGWTRPPDLLIVNDPHGFSMLAGLVAKEIPFLLLVSLAALAQMNAGHRLKTAQTIGFGRGRAWFVTIAPGLYPLIRLPVYAVIAYSASTVDVALILGPTNPPPLAVQILRLMNDPDLSTRLIASAGALAQMAIVVAAISVWRLAELVLWRILRLSVATGEWPLPESAARIFGRFAIALSTTLLAFGFLGLAIASVAGFWRFPSALPAAFTLKHWLQAGDGLVAKILDTAAIGACAIILALIGVLALLESRRRVPTPSRFIDIIFYTPLLIPQISFLFGLAVAAESLKWRPGFLLVVLGHVLFVAPYIYLSLSGPFDRLDPRWTRVAVSLGAGQWGAFWRVRAPLLLRPILVATAVGFAVSVSQYLPTLLLGGGRIATVTTEAVALASGGDRRLIGVWAIAQAILPIIGFWLAFAVPWLLWRNRGGMQGVTR